MRGDGTWPGIAFNRPFSKEIIFILADVKFHHAHVIVPPVVIGYIFFDMFSIYYRYTMYEKITYYTSIVIIVSGVINIILNAFLLPSYGIIAAAYTTTVSYLLMFLLIWIFVKIKFDKKFKIVPLWILWKPTLVFISFVVIFILFTILLPFNIFLFSRFLIYE